MPHRMASRPGVSAEGHDGGTARPPHLRTAPGRSLFCRKVTPPCRKNTLSPDPEPCNVAPAPGTSPYRPMTVDPVARGTEHEPRVEAEVQRAALSQLLKGGPLAEALHVVLVLVVAALVWNSLPLALTIGWVGAVTRPPGCGRGGGCNWLSGRRPPNRPSGASASRWPASGWRGGSAPPPRSRRWASTKPP